MADYEQLFSEYYDLVFRFLLRRCKDPALAEDLTQETFFRAYMNLGQLRERDKAPAWLCQIAKNAFCGRQPPKVQTLAVSAKTETELLTKAQLATL